MSNKSIREIGQVIVSKHSPYEQQLGSFSGFLSTERKRAWHRINTEHLIMQSNANQKQIQETLFQGFQANINLLGKQNEIMESIEGGIQDMAKEMVAQRNVLQSSQQVLEEILDSIQNPKAIEASEKARQASKNILDAKELSKERATRLLSEAVELLKESLEINDYDYKAHFDLGWLYSIYLNDLEKAEYHFDTAVLRSISKDKKFAAYSLRHLADIRKLLGRVSDSLKAISEAEELEKGRNLETKYEHARYLIALNKENEASEKLKGIIETNSAYYVQTETEPEFTNHRIINEMLSELLLNKRSIFINHINFFAGELREKYKTVVDKGDFEEYVNRKVEKSLEIVNSSTFVELTQKEKNDFQIEDKDWTTQEDVESERKYRKKISITRLVITLIWFIPLILGSIGYFLAYLPYHIITLVGFVLCSSPIYYSQMQVVSFFDFDLPNNSILIYSILISSGIAVFYSIIGIHLLFSWSFFPEWVMEIASWVPSVIHK